MKRKRFTEEQTIGILGEAEAGTASCPKLGPVVSINTNELKTGAPGRFG